MINYSYYFSVSTPFSLLLYAGVAMLFNPSAVMTSSNGEEHKKFVTMIANNSSKTTPLVTIAKLKYQYFLNLLKKN